MSENKTTAASTTRQDQSIARRAPLDFGRLTNEIDRFFEDVGFRRGWFGPRAFRNWLAPRQGAWDVWTPDVEVLQRGNNLVIRADLPGLTRDDVKVDVTEDAVTIQGERKREVEEEREGLYRSERSYGSFQRTIALPQGTMPDQATARFRDGVLEITMPAPPQEVSRGRRLEIADESSTRR
jgi:HSP20 family protein